MDTHRPRPLSGPRVAFLRSPRLARARPRRGGPTIRDPPTCQTAPSTASHPGSLWGRPPRPVQVAWGLGGGLLPLVLGEWSNRCPRITVFLQRRRGHAERDRRSAPVTVVPVAASREQNSDLWTRFGLLNELGPQLGCLLWASPRVGAGPADCLGGGAATWAPPSTRRSSQESDVTSIDVAGRVTGGCRRRTTRKVLVDAQARACAVAGAGLRATPRFSGCCPGFETKIGGFARPTCRKFGGDLPRHRRDVLRLRCEGMGLRATSERRDLVSAAEQAGGARCEATTSGGRGVRTASAVTVAISFVPLPLRPPPRPPIPARHPHTHFAGTRAVSLGGHRSGGLGGTSDGRARLRLGVLGCLGRSADRAQKAPVGQVDSEFAIGGCHHRHPDGKPDPPVHCRLPRRGFRAAAADFVMGDFGRPITRVRGAGKKN